MDKTSSARGAIASSWICIVILGAAPGSHADAATGPAPAAGAQSDCSAAYGGKPASCRQTSCPEIYASLLGTWRGQFVAYVREESKPDQPVFRPYHDTVIYTDHDCFTNIASGESFIVGHRTDDFPAFRDLPAGSESGFLITGTRADGSPFLRTIGKSGVNDFSLEYRNRAVGLAIWNLHIPAAEGKPEMAFTTIDGRNLEAPDTNTRNVAVTLTVGPEDHPFWRGVIAHGSHTRE